MTRSLYLLPIAGYATKEFKRRTRAWTPRIEALLSSDPRFKKGVEGGWVYCLPSVRPKKRTWVPKLYLCVGPNQYWPLVMRLMKQSRALNLCWKFYLAKAGYERADKIIVYSPPSTNIKKLLASVRGQLPKRGFHSLGNAAGSGEVGLEPDHMRGVFVGSDPPIGTSWRVYRVVCMAWAELNREYIEGLPGGLARWRSRMNLSSKHDGPRRVLPPAKDIAFVRRSWRRIIEGVTPATLSEFLLARFAAS